MQWRWRCVLLVAAITANNLITGSLGQDSNPAPTDSAQGVAEEPTPSQSIDTPDSLDTPAPTDGVEVEEGEEEEEGGEEDPPDTIDEDTPNDITPSPTPVRSITDEVGADPVSSGQNLVW